MKKREEEIRWKQECIYAPIHKFELPLWIFFIHPIDKVRTIWKEYLHLQFLIICTLFSCIFKQEDHIVDL